MERRHPDRPRLLTPKQSRGRFRLAKRRSKQAKINQEDPKLNRVISSIYKGISCEPGPDVGWIKRRGLRAIRSRQAEEERREPLHHAPRRRS